MFRRNSDRNDIVRSIRQRRIRVFLPRFNRGFCRVNDTRVEEKGDGMGGPVMDFAGVDGRRC